MTRLAWDQVGDRRYETGVSRGVLYLPDGRGVPWNGLTAVEEDASDVESTSYYFDGSVYVNTRYPGDFAGSLKAFTFPDEFEQFDGVETIKNSMQLANQPVAGGFGLCYRTELGNDTDGLDHGYKIHVVYNLTATPDTRTYATLGANQEPMEFSWKLTSVPEQIPGHRPTAHVIFDTTRMDEYLIADLENMLYGVDDGTVVSSPVVNPGGTTTTTTTTPSLVSISGGTASSTVTDTDNGVAELLGGTSGSSETLSLDGGTAATNVTPGTTTTTTTTTPGTTTPGTPTTVTTPSAQLPSLASLISLVEAWVLIYIVDNGDGTWTATGDEQFVIMLDDTTFQLDHVSATYLTSDTYELTNTHSL